MFPKVFCFFRERVWVFGIWRQWHQTLQFTQWGVRTQTHTNTHKTPLSLDNAVIMGSIVSHLVVWGRVGVTFTQTDSRSEVNEHEKCKKRGIAIPRYREWKKETRFWEILRANSRWSYNLIGCLYGFVQRGGKQHRFQGHSRLQPKNVTFLIIYTPWCAFKPVTLFLLWSTKKDI